MEKTYLTRNKKMGKVDCNSFILSSSSNKSCCCGLTWPPKYYTCSFCKRGFKSAQALGGHMNVHRKDRAKLKLFSSFVLECQSSNPNPNSISLSSDHSTNLLLSPHSHSLLSDPLPLPLPATPFSWPPLHVENQRNPLVPQQGDLSKDQKTVSPFLDEVGGVTGLDLERGFTYSKEVLDLELRLGYF